MKLYICENFKTAKWRKDMSNEKQLSLIFAKKCICDFIGEKKREIEIVFTKNGYGKPCVASIYKIIEKNRDETEKIKMDISLFFSISHSENMMICAVACFNIGADCQYFTGSFETCQKIAGRYFSEQENIYLGDLEKEKYMDDFFDIWTKKEAYIKYTGKGLSEGMNTFSVAEKTRQKNYHGEVYFKKINLNAEKNNLYIYLCYNKENKNTWKIKYFN
jgi:phosphopantetheinyl transferase